MDIDNVKKRLENYLYSVGKAEKYGLPSEKEPDYYKYGYIRYYDLGLRMAEGRLRNEGHINKKGDLTKKGLKILRDTSRNTVIEVKADAMLIKELLKKGYEVRINGQKVHFLTSSNNKTVYVPYDN